MKEKDTGDKPLKKRNQRDFKFQKRNHMCRMKGSKAWGKRKRYSLTERIHTKFY